MTREELSKRLLSTEIIVLSLEQWEGLADEFQLLEAHDTCFAGQISTLRGPTGIAVLEEPKPNERVLRAMTDEQAAEGFVAERMSTYDRMWDGCGCKIDYYR